MDKAEIRPALWNSLDMAVLRRDLFLMILIDALCVLIFGFTAGFRDEYFPLAVTIVCFIPLIPVLGYSLWATANIFHKPESYILGRCNLCQPHQCKWARGVMYFTIVLEDARDGGKYILNTRPIFASYGLAGPLLEDYINKTVTVAYNEETETVVVLG